MMRFVCSGWNMDAEKCSACGVYLFRLFICSFKTRASIQFLYTVQLCMLQGKFQEFKYIVIYCIATLFLTKHWHWVRITICGQLTGDMMTSWTNPSLAKVYTPSDALPLQSGFQLKRHFSHLAAWAWDLNCMSTDNRADLTWPASCWMVPAWSHGAVRCSVVTLTKHRGKYHIYSPQLF